MLSNSDSNTLDRVQTFNRLILKKLSKKEHLSFQESEAVLVNIRDGKCTESFIAAFLMSLILNGENEQELAAIVQVIRASSTKITPQNLVPLVDNCGTGGDSLNTFNISTAAALVAGSCKKVAIAKHGNKASSGISGSADFFEYLGYPIHDEEITTHITSIENYGFGFLYAPLFHPSLRSVARVRKELGIRSVFNKVGPLCNPCTNLQAQVIGLSDPTDLELIPNIVAILGLKKALIVRSLDGMDELSTSSTNIVKQVILEDGHYSIMSETLDPLTLGLRKCSIGEFMIKDKLDSIRETLMVIYGRHPNSPKEDIVVLNSAAALVAGTSGLRFEEALSESRECIKYGYPQRLLRDMIKGVGDISKLDSAEKTWEL